MHSFPLHFPPCFIVIVTGLFKTFSVLKHFLMTWVWTQVRMIIGMVSLSSYLSSQVTCLSSTGSTQTGGPPVLYCFRVAIELSTVTFD